MRTVLPVCQQTGVQGACALRRGETHTEMQAATTPFTLIITDRGSPWERTERSRGKDPLVQLPSKPMCLRPRLGRSGAV